MNKLVMFPLTIMIILTFISFVSGTTYQSTYDPNQGGTHNSTTDGDTHSGTYNTGAAKININIWALAAVISGVMILLLTAVGIGIVSGIEVLGSGLGEMAQRLIFKSVFWIGLWTILSLAVLGLLTIDTTGLSLMFWVAISFIEAIGLGFELGGPNIA